MDLTRDAAHVWYAVTETLDETAVASALVLLSDEERARAARFAFARDRRDFAAAHALTRRVLSSYETVAPSAWAFETSARGKPSIAAHQSGAPPLAFNLSHTRGMVACAVARGADIGVDVEQVDPDLDALSLAARHFSPRENEQLAAVAVDQRAARFVEIWTLKEAFIKATGDGLSQPLDAFGFSIGADGAIGFSGPPGVHVAEWTFRLFALSTGGRLAVAIRSADPKREVALRCVEAQGGDFRLLAGSNA